VVSFSAAGWGARRVVADNLGYWFGLVYVPIAVGIGTVLNRIKLMEGRLEHEAIILLLQCVQLLLFFGERSALEKRRAALPKAEPNLLSFDQSS
jgi:hypothetical protein